MKGIIARVSHPQMPKRFYVIKQLPQSQVMKGSTGWMIRDNKIIEFDADAALRIPPDNQLLVLDQDMYVFSEAKLKSLFGYDAKQAAIAEQKVREIEENFKLSFGEGDSIQSLIKGKSKIIKKLQKMDVERTTQDQLLEHAEEMGIEMMTDDRGAIIIMDGKDMDKFVNLLNDDYMESPMTGIRYEILSKKELKPEEESDGPVPASPFDEK
jgi:flagellar biosynthesis/type III secretory pathway chaperone